MAKKCPTGWKVDIRPEGRRGPRVRKIFSTKREAETFEKEQMALGLKGDWKPPVKETRRLQDLIDDWFSLHGHTLKDGSKRKVKLDAICKRLGNPLARTFTGEDFLRYRKQRLSEKLKSRDTLVSPNNLNHEQAYLSAVFGTLTKLRNWALSNPMKDLPKIRLDEKELIFLESSQIKTLLVELENSKNPDVLLVAKLCLATGSRWGEAESLRAEQVIQGKVHFTRTKNSKVRAVPISVDLEAELRQGKPRTGRLFSKSCHDAFKGAIQRAGIQLPDGQMTHVLRHTFASHYMMNSGNILQLKLILGHQSLAMTERYAKLAPEHLADAVTRNPLANL
ncbi:tyrosine-type recombinase/integrase [Microbulbifer sp. OS29]|uniref:Tyrosine-type recombinase/integrase n=1 Tax=Microbulbifer okhotskensis TaxID=2926617 RepID=A0A9X2J8W7_9GAMM|nr:tyrosine-type recombinase/integrase [Microbulbifer okhotskensis]MCO1336001.1 tyrosine-type recombinase/integrase [Microbulbifer okhotskensis]